MQAPRCVGARQRAPCPGRSVPESAMDMLGHVRGGESGAAARCTGRCAQPGRRRRLSLALREYTARITAPSPAAAVVQAGSCRARRTGDAGADGGRWVRLRASVAQGGVEGVLGKRKE
ncbi:hypothetical protein NDU88_004009 [Pleurodeles waltl]|uniref:Uncharacterized protein n=1 Tax=Pleurodeles waltl TaxID=8319 RepID=A0AAV7WUN3_PLEWA|nr:hypothetical protein NDU88_004009 [Pleurodeles waltl]